MDRALGYVESEMRYAGFMRDRGEVMAGQEAGAGYPVEWRRWGERGGKNTWALRERRGHVRFEIMRDGRRTAKTQIP